MCNKLSRGLSDALLPCCPILSVRVQCEVIGNWVLGNALFGAFDPLDSWRLQVQMASRE